MYRYFLYLLIFILCFVNPATAEITNVGRAVFAIQKSDFQCADFINSLKGLEEIHIAYLYNTFGKSNNCLNKVFALPEFESVMVHLINEPGHRNKRLGSYEFLRPYKTPAIYSRLLEQENETLRQRFITYATPVKNFLDASLPTGKQCIVSPGLESNVSIKAAAVLTKWTRELFPGCRILWNPLNSHGKSGTVVGADLIEQHGAFPNVKGACTVNTDGTDINFPSRRSYENNGKSKNFINSGNPLQQYIEEYANKCEMVYLWVGEDNCIRSAGFSDPRARTCAFVKSRKVNRLLANEMRRAQRSGVVVPIPNIWTEDENKSLVGCTSFKNPIDGKKKGFTLKQSEFSNRGAALVIPRVTGTIKIAFFKNGKIVDTFNSGEKYEHDRRWLYRTKKSPLTYPLNMVLKVITRKQTVCYILDNPRIRVD